MTHRQERFFWLAAAVAAAMALLALAGHSQTLQRREPNQLSPKSCRDQMHDNRITFEIAEKLEVSPSTKRDLHSLVVDLGRPEVVANVCANKRIAGLVNLMAADANYRMATSNVGLSK